MSMPNANSPLSVLYMLRIFCNSRKFTPLGDSLNSFQVDVVVVDLDILKEWAASEGVKYEHVGQLCNNPTAKLTVLSVEDAIGREAQSLMFYYLPHLRGFEFAKAVTLIPKQLSLENGLLTPTFKVEKRIRFYVPRSLRTYNSKCPVTVLIAHS
ncbi:hypothetical protein F8388_015792 [Cannabis sativa]|uniref:Uncharacterized protein n=1 Tax=Cannabis sativa TaxID=3483 RepID=A0A7J6FGC2_CANSA|nr:hypothetical protein F8388_015792 [Cannabis sativa]